MTLEVTLPELGDSAFYRPASPQARKLRVTVTEVFGNGRIKIEFPMAVGRASHVSTTSVSGACVTGLSGSNSSHRFHPSRHRRDWVRQNRHHSQRVPRWRFTLSIASSSSLRISFNTPGEMPSP